MAGERAVQEPPLWSEPTVPLPLLRIPICLYFPPRLFHRDAELGKSAPKFNSTENDDCFGPVVRLPFDNYKRPDPYLDL